jgi:hypothetical protein
MHNISGATFDIIGGDEQGAERKLKRALRTAKTHRQTGERHEG